MYQESFPYSGTPEILERRTDKAYWRTGIKPYKKQDLIRASTLPAGNTYFMQKGRNRLEVQAIDIKASRAQQSLDDFLNEFVDVIHYLEDSELSTPVTPFIYAILPSNSNYLTVLANPTLRIPLRLIKRLPSDAKTRQSFQAELYNLIWYLWDKVELRSREFKIRDSLFLDPEDYHIEILNPNVRLRNLEEKREAKSKQGPRRENVLDIIPCIKKIFSEYPDFIRDESDAKFIINFHYMLEDSDPSLFRQLVRQTLDMINHRGHRGTH